MEGIEARGTASRAATTGPRVELTDGRSGAGGHAAYAFTLAGLSEVDFLAAFFSFLAEMASVRYSS